MEENRTIFFGPDEQIGYRLRAQMTVDLPIDVVFDFFADAMELERITPPWLNFSVLTPQPIIMRQGLLLDYRLQIRRIPIFWTTEISEWDRPIRFVDQQLRGPYRRWYHENTFEELNGQTIVRDDVHYIPRGGRLIHQLFVKPDLEKIFRFRQDKLSEIFAEIIAKQSSGNHPPTSFRLGLPVADQENQTAPAREFNS